MIGKYLEYLADDYADDEYSSALGRPPEPKTCKICNEGGLDWGFLQGGWQLVNQNRTKHVCFSKRKYLFSSTERIRRYERQDGGSIPSGGAKL